MKHYINRPKYSGLFPFSEIPNLDIADTIFNVTKLTLCLINEPKMHYIEVYFSQRSEFGVSLDSSIALWTIRRCCNIPVHSFDIIMTAVTIQAGETIMNTLCDGLWQVEPKLWTCIIKHVFSRLTKRLMSVRQNLTRTI